MTGGDAWPYDRIAPFYDEDMGRQSPGDDVQAFASLLPDPPACVVDLGCGTGRIGSALRHRGFRTVEIDRSIPMLRVLQGKDPRSPAVAADARALPIRAGFLDGALFGFCGIQYLTRDDDVLALLAGLRACLRPGAPFLFDLFVHRPAIVGDEFSLDYDRTTSTGRRLRRWKRVIAIGARLNRVERRYRIDDEPPLQTVSRQRWYAPGEIEALFEHGDFAANEVSCSYTHAEGSGNRPRFRLFRAVGRPPR